MSRKRVLALINRLKSEYPSEIFIDIKHDHAPQVNPEIVHEINIEILFIRTSMQTKKIEAERRIQKNPAFRQQHFQTFELNIHVIPFLLNCTKIDIPGDKESQKKRKLPVITKNYLFLMKMWRMITYSYYSITKSFLTRRPLCPNFVLSFEYRMDGADRTNGLLARKRKELGLSQEYMASKLNISVTSYRKIESGKTSLYNKKILKIAEILGTSPARLLFGYPLQEDNEDGILKEEYEQSIQSLRKENEHLERQVRTLQDLLSAKDEIISMLKSDKNTKK